MWKWILLVAAVLVGLVVVGGLIWIGPRNLIGFVTYGRQAREGDLNVGDPAPVVSLIDLDGTTSRELSEWIGARPLVLVFGSFT